MNQLIGPLLLFVGLVLLYLVNFLSFPTATGAFFLVYVLGVIPKNEYFPQVWFESNIFNAFYRLYCTEHFGYKYARPLLHSRQNLPHSDYRHGVRCLSGEHKSPPGFSEILQKNFEFYKRGGGAVDLEELGKGHEMGFNGVVIVPVPLLSDNYAYFILGFATGRCAVVDPADPNLVMHMLNVIRHYTKVNFVLTDILTTHKHWDHSGGNLELWEIAQKGGQFAALVDAQLKIYGSFRDKPLACTDFVNDGDAFAVADGAVDVVVFSSSCHTVGSVLFLVGDAFSKTEELQRLALFTGDCIFSGGCGALFETTTVDNVLRMRDIFYDEKIQIHPATKQFVLAENVLLYVGHEYTERLIDTMIKVHASCADEVRNKNLEMQKFCKELRSAMQTTRLLRSTRIRDETNALVPFVKEMCDPWCLPACTVPSTLALERRINPLLTVRRSVLERLCGVEFSSCKILDAIYNSKERHIAC